jgi:hypothetical protein
MVEKMSPLGANELSEFLLFSVFPPGEDRVVYSLGAADQITQKQRLSRRVLLECRGPLDVCTQVQRTIPIHSTRVSKAHPAASSFLSTDD